MIDIFGKKCEIGDLLQIETYEHLLFFGELKHINKVNDDFIFHKIRFISRPNDYKRIIVISKFNILSSINLDKFKGKSDLIELNLTN